MDKIQIYEELERRGELSRLPAEKQALWAEYKNRQSGNQNPTAQLTPLTEEQKAKPSNRWSGVFSAGLEGAGKGAAVGGSRVLNGATLGALDWADRRLGGNLTNWGNEIQQDADIASLGTLNKATNFGLDLAGNMAGAGGALVKGGAKLGLKGLGLGAATGATEGSIYGATGSDSWDELPQNMALGGLAGGALGYALPKAAGYVGGKLSPLKPLLGTAYDKAFPVINEVRGGIKNVLDNTKMFKSVAKGLKYGDDALSEDFLNKALPEARAINQNSADMVNSSLTNRINVPETVATEKAKYGQFMNEHAGDEILDFTPTEEQIINYPAQSKFNLPKQKLNSKKAQDILYDKAAKNDIPVAGTPRHYTDKNDRAQYVRTLANTWNNPDMTMSAMVENSKGNLVKRDYLIKKYNQIKDGQSEPFFDFIVKDQGSLYTKYKPDELSYIAGKFKKAPQDVSLAEHLIGANPTHGQPTRYINNIARKNIVVNPNLPHVSTLYDGLNKYQRGALSEAIGRGAAKTNQKAGTLESLNKAKQEINDMINKSQDVNPNNRLSSVDSSDTVELRKVKKVVDDILGDALKGRDKGYKTAKRLEEAYNQGRRYNPNGVNNDDLIPSLSPLERNAFTQGLFRKMTNNSLSGENLAGKMLKYENALAKVLPQSKYGELVGGLNKQSTKFERLANLGRKAESQLRTPEADQFFGREQLENKGSMLGAALDFAKKKVFGDMYAREAANLLNPEYLRVIRSVDPVLANGLTAEALNNLLNYDN